jgi:hypothetical protein
MQGWDGIGNESVDSKQFTITRGSTRSASHSALSSPEMTWHRRARGTATKVMNIPERGKVKEEN